MMSKSSIRSVKLNEYRSYDGVLPDVIKVATLFACCFVLSTPDNAVATTRFYRDIVRYSPKKTVRLEACSPDNAKDGSGRRRGFLGFQSDFTYTMYAGETNDVIWQRKQVNQHGRREASPIQIFADDTKWAVIRTGWERLITIDPYGKAKLKLDILKDALTETERSDYTSQTTAGIMWGGLSLWYFAQIDGNPYFCIRTGWGRRILVDLVRGRLVAEENLGLSELMALERDFAMGVLKEAVSPSDFEAKERFPYHRVMTDVKTAVSMAAQLNLEDALPLLRKLESCPYIGSSGGIPVSDLKTGEINPWKSGRYDVRMLVQLALRRFSQRPQAIPTTRLRYYSATGLGEEYESDRLLEPRETRVNLMKKGMMPLEVLGIIGPPDYVAYDSWEYDMDAPKPFTLRVKWGEDRRVSTIQRVEPALWLQGNKRDKNFIDSWGASSRAWLDELCCHRESLLEQKRQTQRRWRNILIVVVAGAAVALLGILYRRRR